MLQALAQQTTEGIHKHNANQNILPYLTQNTVIQTDKCTSTSYCKRILSSVDAARKSVFVKRKTTHLTLLLLLLLLFQHHHNTTASNEVFCIRRLPFVSSSRFLVSPNDDDSFAYIVHIWSLFNQTTTAVQLLACGRVKSAQLQHIFVIFLHVLVSFYMEIHLAKVDSLNTNAKSTTPKMEVILLIIYYYS